MTQKVAKEAARRDVLERRDALDPAFRHAVSLALARCIDALPLPATPTIVSGFHAIRSEIDPVPLLQAIAARGHQLCLPVVLEDRETMVFRPWHDHVPLIRSGFGLSVPPPEAGEVAPRVLLVPLAAFDRRGYRIGYGKGHYDRALARLEADGPVMKIGVAFAMQEIAEVPHEPHDRHLDHVLTENGLMTCGMN